MILLLSAMVCFAIVATSGLAYNHYAIHYGRHGWGPPEVAFLLHYLLFGSTAVLLLGVALDLAVGRRLTEAFDRLATLSARSAWSVMALASVLVFGLITLSRYALLGDTAITDDENVYSFMARTFASGRLYLESMPEPVRPFFDNHFIINDGKWYGIYFPGHPALLALGERFHLMRWMPTYAAALTVLLTFAVGRRVFGPRAALMALPLLAISPFFILSSATLLGHSTAGLLLMAFVYSTLRVLERPERMVLVAGGRDGPRRDRPHPAAVGRGLRASLAGPARPVAAPQPRRPRLGRGRALLPGRSGLGRAASARITWRCPETRSPPAITPSGGSPACPSPGRAGRARAVPEPVRAGLHPGPPEFLALRLAPLPRLSLPSSAVPAKA